MFDLLPFGNIEVRVIVQIMALHAGLPGFIFILHGENHQLAIEGIARLAGMQTAWSMTIFAAITKQMWGLHFVFKATFVTKPGDMAPGTVRIVLSADELGN